MLTGFICQSQLKSFIHSSSPFLSYCVFWFGLPFHFGITCFCSNPNMAQSWLSATGLQDRPLSLLTVTLTPDLFSGSPSIWGIVWTLLLSCVNESGDKWEWSWPLQPVCEWGLGHNTACVVLIFGQSLTFAVSASVFVSVSICWCLSTSRAVFAHALPEQDFCILIPLCSLRLFMHSAVC